MIVGLGGGKGLTSLLLALKHRNIEFGAVVETTDSGGSTGRLRQMYNVPAMGDIRRVVDHLSESELGKALEKRVDGHAVGNLVLLQLMREDGFGEAVRKYREFLGVKSRIEPLFMEACDLVARTSSGIVFGEEAIDEHSGISEMWIEPEVEANPDAVELVESADAVVLGPGSIFTSVMPHLLAGEMRNAVRRAPLIVYVAGISNDLKSTENFRLSDYLRALEQVGGIKPDRVVAQDPPRGIEIDSECIRADVAKDDHFHDPEKLGEVLWKLLH